MKPIATITREDGSLKEEYVSDDYYVAAIRHLGDILQIIIMRKDFSPLVDWRDKQAIKNQIAGLESEAIELFPAESRVVDNQNWTHLWLLLDGEKFPFGFEKGDRCNDPAGQTQRPLGVRSDTSQLVRAAVKPSPIATHEPDPDRFGDTD